jgi:hypothetical protein
MNSGLVEASDVFLIPLLPPQSPSSPFPKRVVLIMKSFIGGLSLALLGFCSLELAGCGEDNEAFIKEQASKAKGTIPGSRSAQAQTQEEYFEITPGVQGVGTASGPRPARGAGYPGSKR